MSKQGWIGVDLDRTLAHYDTWKDPYHIGAPVEPMLQRVKDWIAQGHTVKIFTARAAIPEHIPPVKAWLAKHGLPDLEVTCTKDLAMWALFDDRAVSVEANTGRLLREGGSLVP